MLRTKTPKGPSLEARFVRLDSGQTLHIGSPEFLVTTCGREFGIENLEPAHIGGRTIEVRDPICIACLLWHEEDRYEQEERIAA